MEKILDFILGLWLLISAIIGALFILAGGFVFYQTLADGIDNNIALIIVLVGMCLAGIGIITLNQIVNIAKTQSIEPE